MFKNLHTLTARSAEKYEKIIWTIKICTEQSAHL